MTELRYLMEKFLAEVYGGTAHPSRKAVLAEFITWIENRETGKVLTKYLNDKLKGLDVVAESVTVRRRDQ